MSAFKKAALANIKSLHYFVTRQFCIVHWTWLNAHGLSVDPLKQTIYVDGAEAAHAFVRQELSKPLDCLEVLIRQTDTFNNFSTTDVSTCIH